MTGTVTRIFLSKGYGFIRDDDGTTRFFHAGEAGAEWDDLREGVRVTFKPIPGPSADKLRAGEVRVYA